MSFYLMQRLCPPPKHNTIGHRVFGGGMLGLSQKSW